MPNWIADAWYDFCYSVSWVTMTIGFSMRTEGSRNVPRTGPALLVANHQSFFDPPGAGLAAGRRLNYLARKTLFDHPLFGKLLRSLKAVPVDQEGMAAAGLKAILDQLEEGHAVLVFPEGERSWDGVMQPLKPGVALMIKRVMPPVVPIGIAGACDALPRGAALPRFSPIFWPRTGGDFAVSIGKPLDGKRLACMPRKEMLETLFHAIQDQQRRAEQLRRRK